MIGREADLERVLGVLDEGALLVTIAGPAGVGKTTLAGHVVGALAERGAQAVYFADLTHATSVADIEGAVLRALSREAAWREHAHLGAVLESLGPTILVLDNFEQVVGHADQTVASWISSVPELQVVVTSRERLRLPFEVVHDLRPLAVPRAAGEDSAALELWIQRVRAIDASYSVDASSAGIVAELVRRLDGLPLAIELAAARLGRLSTEDLRVELEALALAPGLRDAIDASFELLTADEQTVFAACGVFRGDISVEAIQAVSGVPNALDAVASLLDK
ncbi:MAG: NACHT domain-containing protein [Polyangiaceae bacterium]